jgi:hypothetical protein
MLLTSCAHAGDPQTLASGFHSLYSPFLFGERLYMGGWQRLPERVPWPDRLFQARRSGEGWTKPVPLRWSGGREHGGRAGEVPGFHANDPVVVRDPESGRLVLLYTAFANDAVDPLGCDPTVNPLDCLDTRRNAVAWMTSKDEGKSWTDRGVLLRSEDGALSPAAVVRGENLWVYYMDANLPVEASGLWRQRVNLLGMIPVGGPQRLLHPGTGMSNVDVSIVGERFFLVGNRARTSRVVLYESADGVLFREPACHANPVVEVNGVRLHGPHIESVSPLRILTGYDEGGGSARIVRFTITSVCAA